MMDKPLYSNGGEKKGIKDNKSKSKEDFFHLVFAVVLFDYKLLFELLGSVCLEESG